jgi:predicted transcriptional regulator
LITFPHRLKIYLLALDARSRQRLERSLSRGRTDGHRAENQRMSDPGKLSRRERQIMDVVYARGEATATDVLAGLSDPPTRSAVRALLRILEAKGHLEHRKAGREFVYRPTRPRAQAGRSALRRVLSTFFEGSLEKALAAHLSSPSARLTPEEVRRLSHLIEQAEKRESSP